MATCRRFSLGRTGKSWRQEGAGKSRMGTGLTRHVWQSPPSKRGWKDTGFFLPQDKQLSVTETHTQLATVRGPMPAAEALGLMSIIYSTLAINQGLFTLYSFQQSSQATTPTPDVGHDTEHRPLQHRDRLGRPGTNIFETL